MSVWKHPVRKSAAINGINGKYFIRLKGETPENPKAR